jgi:hypothetical protein
MPAELLQPTLSTGRHQKNRSSYASDGRYGCEVIHVFFLAGTPMALTRPSVQSAFRHGQHGGSPCWLDAANAAIQPPGK